MENPAIDQRPAYDPACYLCPRNGRAGGELRNPDYASTFVFPNDFPAVQAQQPQFDSINQQKSSLGKSTDTDVLKERRLFGAQSARGECHVICFHPRHDLTIAQMSRDEIIPVIEAWTALYRDNLRKAHVQYVQLFENKGAAMGCSNPHPHGILSNMCVSLLDET